MLPYYMKLWNLFSEAGTPLFSLDSDGDMNPIMDNIVKCHVNTFLPCEPAAGMDAVQLRKKYGNKLALKGGIDKYVLSQSKADIQTELEYKL